MDLIANLSTGFSVALAPINLVFVTAGVIIGTLIGALPGIGPVAGLSILIPLAFGMDPTGAMILMCGVYYGCMYGGTITSVLLNVPGESSSLMTCLDGYQMAQQGRAGPALTIAAIGSFIAGTFSVVMLTLLAPPLAEAALSFGPPEYFALMLLGLSAITGLTGRSRAKGYAMGFIGLAMATIGLDPLGGVPRFSFGHLELLDGIGFLPIAVGMFGLGTVLAMVDAPADIKIMKTTLREMVITRQDMKESAMPIVRGTIIGFAVGVLPGAGATISTFLAYAAEKRLSKTPEKFGTGTIAGVAAPESANNASTGGAMIPLLTLGIPGSGTTAVLLGVLTLFSLQPGPLLFTKNPEFVWGLIASMYIGNVMLLVLNIAFVPAFVSVLKIPYRILAPLIAIFCLVGVYSVNNSLLDLWLMFTFGLIGYLANKLAYPLAPLVLALVLGGYMEVSLRQSLKMAQGDLSVFFTRPIAAVIMVIAIAIILWPLFAKLFSRSPQAGKLPVSAEEI
ncbi:MAG: tripartite tricarboxylate transporter permease [Betaproteobacteria bacterium]|nr:MAG: tripartite tricarboxylate transporter permease [Betaproteobacteria bacterium]